MAPLWDGVCAHEFGRLAAPIAIEFIRRSTSVAVGWGRTLNAITRFIETSARDDRNEAVNFFPLWGHGRLPGLESRKPSKWSSKEFPSDDELQSSRLTIRLQNAFTPAPRNATDQPARRNEPTLDYPGFIPLEIKQCDAIRAYVRTWSDYKELFENDQAGGTKGLASVLDTILASAGSPEPLPIQEDTSGHISSRFWHHAFLLKGFGEDKKEIERLEKAALGDICGVIIPKPESESKNKEQWETDCRWIRETIMENHWLGVQMHHLKACAARAVTEKKPGVVIFALGKVRAKIITEGIRLGMISRLISDEGLAESILEGLGGRKPEPPKDGQFLGGFW